MLKSNYIGKRFIALKEFDGRTRIIGEEGTCIDMYHSVSDNWIVTINFDNYIGGHSHGGMGQDGHCWNIPITYVEKVLPPVVVAKGVAKVGL